MHIFASCRELPKPFWHFLKSFSEVLTCCSHQQIFTLLFYIHLAGEITPERAKSINNRNPFIATRQVNAEALAINTAYRCVCMAMRHNVMEKNYETK
jgi:hypothetical protein